MDPADHPGEMSRTAPKKQLRLRRAGHCAVCGHALAAGESAIWDSAARTVTCLTCELADAPVLEGDAGASAQREYDRRH